MTEHPRRPGRAIRAGNPDGEQPPHGERGPLPEGLYHDDQSWGRATGEIPSGLFREAGPDAPQVPRRAEPVPPPSSHWDRDETSVESTLYVSLNDFFGGRLSQRDPVLADWLEGRPDEQPEQPPAPTPEPEADPEALVETAIRKPLSDQDLQRLDAERAAAPAEPDGAAATTVARNSALMAAGTMVSRVLGQVRTALLAAAFGVSVVGDAFQVANTLPNYVYILLSAGVLNAVLVPQITKAMKRSDGGKAFVDRLLTVSLGLVLVTALLATLAAPLLVRLTSNLPPDAHDAAVFFAYLCLPQIAFYGLYTVLGQVLNSRGQFAAFMWAPALANVVQITGLVWFLVAWGRQAPGAQFSAAMMWVLGLSATLGIVAQGLSLIWPLWRGGFRWTPRFDIRGHGLGSASRILGWTFTALVIAQIGGFFVQQVMTTIRGNDPDVPSVLAHSQAFQIFMLPHSLVTVSILTALFPSLSRAHQDGDTGRMRQLLRRSLSMPAVAVIPMSVAMIALAYPIVRVLLPAGGTDHVAVAWILAAMSLGVMAFGVTTLQQRYCFAREDGRTNLWLQGLLTGVQILVALVAFLVPAEWAVFTIALGQTLANTVAGVAFILVARRQLGGLDLRPVGALWLRLAAASLVAGVAAFAVVWLLGRWGGNVGIALLQLVLGGGLFVAIAYLGTRKLGVTELDELLAPVLRRLGRTKA